MTMAARIAGFKAAYAKWPASWPYLVQEQGRDVLYATWLIGATWGSTSGYYGAYPRTFIDRIMALFPTAPQTLRDRGLEARDVLHVFSGGLPAGPYTRLDVNPDLAPELVGSVYDIPKLCLGKRQFRLVLADPPYSAEHAKRYGTPMVNRGRAMRALARVTKAGGHLIWLDQCWPMHRKDEWLTVGRITVIRSTNHIVRVATIFERTA